MLTDGEKAEDLSCKVRVRITTEMSCALNCLDCHDPRGPAFHRDVKSPNIVLTLALSPKLIDCGLSTFIPDQQRHGTIMSTRGAILGTPGYTCPKYASGGSEYDAKSENFSFGMESFCLSCFWEDCKASVKMTSLASTLTTKPHYLMT